MRFREVTFSFSSSGGEKKLIHPRAQVNILQDYKSQHLPNYYCFYNNMTFGIVTATHVVWLGLVKIITSRIVISSLDFSLLVLLLLTSFFAAVIINPTTRGRCLTRNLNTGRNKLLSHSTDYIVIFLDFSPQPFF